MNARLEPHINLHDVFLNPSAAGIMQFQQNLGTDAFSLKPLFELADETDELEDKFGFAPVGVCVTRNAAQPVDVGDQHFVLGVHQRVAGFKLFTPS
jgi:hypothetical protein